jgi:hypothetical protein
MLALKKKREAEKKQAEEEAAAAAQAPASAPTTETKKVSLFGIGGEKKNKKDEPSGTKKTPGEIRIQKGEQNTYFKYISNCLVELFNPGFHIHLHQAHHVHPPSSSTIIIHYHHHYSFVQILGNSTVVRLLPLPFQIPTI